MLARCGVLPGTDALMELGARQGWAGGEADPSDVDQAKREAEFHEIRDAIEQIMQYKVAQRYAFWGSVPLGWDTRRSAGGEPTQQPRNQSDHQKYGKTASR